MMPKNKAEFSLDELQEVQKQHDALYHSDLEAMDVKRQIAHTVFHLAKVLGHLGNYLEKSEHGEDGEALHLENELKEKWVPDLLIYTLKLSNLFGIKVAEAYWQRIMEDRHKQKARVPRPSANETLIPEIPKK